MFQRENTVPTYQAGESREWVLTVTNETSAPIEQIAVAPDLGEGGQDWPFQTQVQDYRQEIGSLQAGRGQGCCIYICSKGRRADSEIYDSFLVASADGVLSREEILCYDGETGSKNSHPADRMVLEMSSRVLAEEAREAQTMIFYLLMQEDSVMEVHPTVAVPVEMVLYRG